MMNEIHLFHPSETILARTGNDGCKMDTEMTSIGAITGALTIARGRGVGLVVGGLWAGAILCGLVYDFLLPIL
jgi:hypothetical protein